MLDSSASVDKYSADLELYTLFVQHAALAPL